MALSSTKCNFATRFYRDPTAKMICSPFLQVSSKTLKGGKGWAVSFESSEKARPSLLVAPL